MPLRSAILLLLIAVTTVGQEWPRFRGPDGSGLVPELPIPATFALDDARWNVKLPGKGHSSPVIWNDRIWVTCEGTERGRRSLVCLSTADGSRVWAKDLEFEPHAQHRFNSSASSTPAADGQRVYVAWTTGRKLVATAFDHAGKRLWRRELGPSTAQHGSGASPVVIDDIVLVGNDHEGDGSALFGLDAKTGEPVWKRDRDSTRASYATPIVRRADGKVDVIFASTSHGITCLEPKTGRLLWETGPGFRQRFVGSPAIADGVLFAAAGSGGGGKESIAVELPAVGAKAEAKILYRVRRRLPYVTSPIGIGQRFFSVADGGFASCLDAKTGDEVWNERLDGSFYASPICIGDRIYVVSRSGELFVLKAADEFELLGRVDLGEASYATPAVADGTLYLRTETRLIAVGAKKEPEPSAPWGDFRGPTQDGHAPAGADVPLTWSETENVAWKTDIVGTGWSSPVVGSGMVWMTSATEKGKKQWVVGVDLATGDKVVERVLFENEKPQPKNALNSFASPSPVTDGKHVWVHYGDYGTACLDVRTGETIWERRDINCDHKEGPGSSPILFEDLLIFHMDGIDVQYVIALEKATGKTRWKVDRDVKLAHLAADLRKAYSTPILVDVDGKTQLVSSCANATFGYDPRSGEQLWRVKRKGFSMSSRTVAGLGMLFVNTGFMRPTIIAIRKGASGEATDTHVEWTFSRSVPTMPSPVLVGDRLYIVNDGGVATCVDARTGKALWRERLGGEHSASILYAGGHLYYFDRHGDTVVMKPGDKVQRVAENRLESGCMASPAVVGNALILRTKTHLYRIESTSKK